MSGSGLPQPAWLMDIQVIHSFEGRIVLSNDFLQLSMGL
jgi:hypothetical protein